MRLLKRVQADQERVLGPGHPDTVSTRSHLAAACLAAGRLQVATNLLERARDDLERVRGPDDLDTLTTQANLALAYRRAGRLKAAAELYRQTLAHSGQALGHDHPVTRAVRQSLADLREIPN